MNPGNEERTEIGQDKSRCNSCGRSFKGTRGVKIHQAKSTCKAILTQRKVVVSQEATANKSVEDLSQEANHRAENSHVHDIAEAEQTRLLIPGHARKHRLMLPPSSDKRWAQFDRSLDAILENTLKGQAVTKIPKMTTIIYEECKTTFGLAKETTDCRKAGPSRRQKKIATIRQNKRNLAKLWKKAPPEEKPGLQSLQNDLHAQLSHLRRAEQLRKKQREKRRKRKAFFRNPYKFTTDLLGKPKNGELKCTAEEAEANVRACHSDPLHDVPLPECPYTLTAQEPEIPFDCSDIRFDEIQAIVRKARAASAPGPSGSTYKIYKSCPLLVKRLWRYLRVIWKNKVIPPCWTIAEGCFIPKEANSSLLNQFREISLLDVEGKIFWAVVAKRLIKYMTTNKYFDPSRQKGCLPGYAGCLEHTSAISQLIQEATKGKKTLAVVWLDLSKAYPSLPHQLITMALDHYHIPPPITNMIQLYLNSLRMRFTTRHFTTKWQSLEKGIMAGCTISVVLFVTAMNLILCAGTSQCRGPKSHDGIRHPSCRAFMDDVTAMTQSPQGTRWVITALEKMANWARMRFNPEKSRSLAIYKGRVNHSFAFKIQGDNIPTIGQQPIKCLGKLYNQSLSDKEAVDTTTSQLKEWLMAIDNSSLQSRFKAWCFQFGVIPRLQWPFTIYEIPITAVLKMEAVCSKFLRKWMGVPPSFSTANLYSKTSKLRLPLSSVLEEFKVAKARAIASLKMSKDPIVHRTGDKLAQGNIWNAHDALSIAEEQLKHNEVVGIVCKGRQGLGNYGVNLWSKANNRMRRDMLIEQIRQATEKDRMVTLVGQAKQGRWTHWDAALDKPLTWNDIWSLDQGKLSFMLRALTDLLPSPANLKIWGLADSAICQLCGSSNCSLNHILSSCPKALGEGRYTWRHNKVLEVIAKWVDQERHEANLKEGGTTFQAIKFQKEGDKTATKTTKGKGVSILSKGTDWDLLVDLKKKLVFPQDIVITTQRPDMVLLSRKSKRVFLIELTVPWEDRLQLSHLLKKDKYQDLVDEAMLQGWHALCFPIEVGCRGFPSSNLQFMFKQIGLSSVRLKRALKDIGGTAESCSRWLWLRRNLEWCPAVSNTVAAPRK